MFRSFIPAYIWSFIIIVLLCLPGADIPKVPSLNFKGIDKLAHITLFAVSQYLWMYPRIYKKGQHFKNMNLRVGIILSLGGVLLEFVQQRFIPNRSFEIDDIIADMAGVLMGAVVVRNLWAKKLEKPL